MAENSKAEDLINEGFDTGTVMATGRLHKKTETFAIIRFSKGGMDYFVDYGGDIRLNSDLEIGQKVKLVEHDKYCFEWIPVIPKMTLEVE